MRRGGPSRRRPRGPCASRPTPRPAPSAGRHGHLAMRSAFAVRGNLVRTVLSSAWLERADARPLYMHRLSVALPYTRCDGCDLFSLALSTIVRYTCCLPGSNQVDCECNRVRRSKASRGRPFGPASVPGAQTIPQQRQNSQPRVQCSPVIHTCSIITVLVSQRVARVHLPSLPLDGIVVTRVRACRQYSSIILRSMLQRRTWHATCRQLLAACWQRVLSRV